MNMTFAAENYIATGDAEIAHKAALKAWDAAEEALAAADAEFISAEMGEAKYLASFKYKAAQAAAKMAEEIAMQTWKETWRVSQ